MMIEEINTAIERMRTKINQLRKQDVNLQVFGSRDHQYKMFAPKTENELQDFEHQYQVKLPPMYRTFINQIGNGGAGPYYGLEQLESGLYSDLDYKDKKYLINPSEEFMLEEAWNLDFTDLAEEEYFRQKDEVYFDDKWVNGLLRIVNFGCGVSINLVVNGKEYGNIWIDDRCNDGGIYPDTGSGTKERLGFLDWYELWLNKSINELTGQV